MQTEQDIVASLEELKEMAPAGYALAFHVQFNAPSFLFQTYPKVWTDIYSQKGYVIHDPTVAWAFSQEGHIRWSELTEQDTANVMSEAAEYGLVYGVTFALSNDDSRSLASFARSDREFEDDEIAKLDQAISGLHNATAEIKALSPEMTERLKKLSIRFVRGDRG